MNHSPRNRYTSLVIIAMLLSSCVGGYQIGSPGASTGAGNPNRSSDPEVTVSVGITAGEARRLAVNHGLTGMRALPPGIQRRLAQGKPLPPGIARQMAPDVLLNDLPKIPDHEWYIAGKDLILIAVGTLIVVDILAEVFD